MKSPLALTDDLARWWAAVAVDVAHIAGGWRVVTMTAFLVCAEAGERRGEIVER
jgi:hypothetical protein